MHRYRIIPNEKLIVQTLYGDVNFSDFLQFCITLFRDPDFSSSYAMVWDFRSADILLTLEELKAAAEKFLDADRLHGRKALLVNRSVDTAKIMIFRDHVGPDHRFCVYSTVEGASSFLQRDLSQFLDDDVSIREDVYREGTVKRNCLFGSP